MRAGDDVGDELGFHRIGHRWFQYANDDCGTRAHDAIEPHRLSDHAGIMVQRCAPESIGQHSRAGGVWAIVAGSQQASKHRTQPHHLEVVAIHYARGYFARRAEPYDGEVDLGKGAERLDRFEPVPDVLNFRNGECGVRDADARSALA